jgi:DNA-binding transcriptional LysR family regulator
MLPAIRSRFAATHPDIQIELRQIGWQDATAGLADGMCDAAFVWLPIAEPNRYQWIIVAEEPCVVAFPATHPFAGVNELYIDDVLDQPLLAIPEEAGPLRNHWLLDDHRNGVPCTIGAVVRSADETYEALIDGRGVVVLASGNAPLLEREGIAFLPLLDAQATRLALAWRRGGETDAVIAYVESAGHVARERYGAGQ